MLPYDTAFDGVVRRCLQPTEGETDLMNALHEQKVQIEDMVRVRASQTSRSTSFALLKCALAK